MNLIEYLTLIKKVQEGETEIGCPDIERGQLCNAFGRGSEYGSCCCEDWYLCPEWIKMVESE